MSEQETPRQLAERRVNEAHDAMVAACNAYEAAGDELAARAKAYIKAREMRDERKYLLEADAGRFSKLSGND